MDLHERFLTNGYVIDCGRNTSTIYSTSSDSCKTITHDQLMLLPKSLPSGSVVVCEAAHLRSPRTKFSRSQPFTEEELFELYASFREKNITLKLFPQKSTPRACSYSGLEKSDENDPKSIAILLKDFKPLFDSLENPPRDEMTTPIREASYEYKKLTSAFINVARREPIPYREDGCSKFILDNLYEIADRLSESSKDIFGLTEESKYKKNCATGKKGNWKHNAKNTNVKMGGIYAVVCTLIDDEGNVRVRPETGSIAGWKYIKKYILCMTPNHFRGGVARSNLYYHIGMNWIQRQAKQNGFDLERKVPKMGDEEKMVVVRRGNFTPEEDAFFLSQRKIVNDAIRELWQVTRDMIKEKNMDLECYSEKSEFNTVSMN